MLKKLYEDKQRVLFSLAVGIVGAIALSGVFAFNNSDSKVFEAESSTVSGCVKYNSDSNASDGQYVEFSGSGCDDSVLGELKKWHKVTLLFEGPNTNETATPNPFTDYRLDVTFTNGDSTYVVPGYYAADGNAANTSEDAGNIWLAHFTPDETGTWNYSVSFKQGSDVAIGTGGNSAGFMDGITGNFDVADSDKSGRDHRATGRLEYVGQHYLRYAESGDYFIKAGPDAPENTLAYEDFDATPDAGGRRKSWSPHQQDYVDSDASPYTWQSGKGSELLGAINYLHNQDMNAFSFLTLSISGDDDNVYPYVAKTSGATDWNNVHHDRFDVSKMAQWDKIFEYADKKGMYLHFKTLETENDNLMDNNSFGRERKLYYRELIARFGYHLALNWNISEEVTLPEAVVKSTAAYIKDIDPYYHNIVVHTYPGDTNKYGGLTGNQSELTGASMQINITGVHSGIRTWVANSANAGKKWIVANDEQGGANTGVDKDPNDRELVRREVIWGTLMAGGAGFEYYYGYGTGCTDLTCQDHRTRASKWVDAKIAKNFFNQYLSFWEMVSNDGRTSTSNDYVYEKPGEVYAIYLENGGTTSINLSGQSGSFSVKWYDPRNGGDLSDGSVTSINGGANRSIGNPPNSSSSDWVVLVKK